MRDVLDDEAAVEDVRISTLANRMCQEELQKVMDVGIDNCFITNSKEYRNIQESDSNTDDKYYLFPKVSETEKFISTQWDNKMYPQISFYFTLEQMEIMQQLVMKQRIPKTISNGEVKSYRYVIVGMLLNHSVSRSLRT